MKVACVLTHIITGLFSSFANAANSVVDTGQTEYFSSQKYLLDPMSIHYSEDHPFDNKSTMLKNPRILILKSISCWSERDSHSICSQTVFYSEGSSFLTLSEFQSSEGLLPSNLDSALLTKLRENSQAIEKIELKQSEKTDKFSIMFEVLPVSAASLLVTSLIELLISNYAGSKFDWAYCIYPTVGIASTYSAYRYLTLNQRPSVHIVTINFRN
jgi:hypothetical protein